MTDYTTRATEAGWSLPDGWTIRAVTFTDEWINHPREEYGDDGAYTQEAFDAYDRGDWGFVVVRVSVQDARGREWGSSSLGAVEAGTFPMDDGGSVFIDPLEDEPAQYSVVREHDLIQEALRDAVKALEEFGDPHGLIREPATSWTGV